jgi:hypothetical protein
MTVRWPDPDRAYIGHYVASLDLRNIKSRTCYRQVLHGFQDVVDLRFAVTDSNGFGPPIDISIRMLRISPDRSP